jgi:molybdopterin-guanine dinucleotide biosynthesis protein A
MLRQENYRIRDLYSLVRVRTVPEDELRAVDPTLQSFTNANTPQEWAAIRQMLAAR